MSLKKWLFENDKSVQWLSKKMGVSRAIIHLWIRGKHYPHQYNLKKISKITNGAILSKQDIA